MNYARDVSGDVWVGAVTTLVGAVVGGVISFFLSWQQVKEARRQRQEDDVRELRRRSADRRFQAYADFLTRTRSFRNAMEAYYLQAPRANCYAERWGTDLCRPLQWAPAAPVPGSSGHPIMTIRSSCLLMRRYAAVRYHRAA
jgi:hypothetical protein